MSVGKINIQMVVKEGRKAGEFWRRGQMDGTGKNDRMNGGRKNKWIYGCVDG